MSRAAAAEGRPPLPVRLIARGQTAVLARAPFLWPVLRRPTHWFWQKAAAGWDKRRDQESPERLAPLAAACDRLSADPLDVLELGTGTGAGALMLVRRFSAAKVVATDFSEAMIDAAKGKLPPELEPRLKFQVADAAALPYPSASFDLVAQLNLPLFAEEAARVLRPGGHVVVASTLGAATPYYTPDRVLRRRFERLGLLALPSGSAGAGTYFVAQRPPE
jgi:SAM-dependent methyltransferase